ncbi:DUF4097 family beta strand repeat-containing protein [Hymenobacter sp. GOD-10R]|uniref:DUF4097 family beta strand repeat-containing protein n=1 Tax=Hymenobacter sp. GOD-10R TaxID=3093922 RepID=UPI002D7654FE|nr:DUF4097 family beta strand repeat-containing protein [Hymenobacter sp. GOD-10R]WRQ28635.1 DUF4097 family beta strand repeat-containing protein [Hymenobacter sp. GOD-10R]
MKKSVLLAAASLVLAASSALHAQEYRTKLGGKANKIVIEMQAGDVNIEGTDGDEVIIKGNGYEEPNKRAEGLHPVYNSAVDNTKLGLSVTSTDNTLRIVKASRKDATYTIRVPRRADVSFTQSGWGGGGDLLLQNLNGSLEVTMKNASAKLLNVTGPVVANTVSGDITVRFASLRPEPSSISVVSGDVDVTLPSSSKTTLTMRSISGELYTDLDLSMGKGTGNENMRQVGGQTVSGTLNGGGTALSLKTVSGDVFVRKAK